MEPPKYRSTDGHCRTNPTPIGIDNQGPPNRNLTGVNRSTRYVFRIESKFIGRSPQGLFHQGAIIIDLTSRKDPTFPECLSLKD